MTRRRFVGNILFFAGVSFLIILISAADVFVFDPSNNQVSVFLKEMSVYFLLCVAPYIAYMFSIRQKFIEKIEVEWRRVVEVKSDMLAYCDDPSLEQYGPMVRKLSCAIDNMRCVYKNVGQDRHYIGYYPFETLHDFRKILNELKFKPDEILDRRRFVEAKVRIEDSFNAFRDIYLIEIDPPEPSFPIISHRMKRQKKDFVSDKKYGDIIRKQARMEAYFAVSGESVRNK